jgi:hypothetical protein
MVKRCGGFVVLSLLAVLCSRQVFAQSGPQSPLVSSNCAAGALQAVAAPALLEGVLTPSLPGLTPSPVPRATYLCGACSQADCGGQFEGDTCTFGSFTGTCWASFSTICSTHPTRYYCGCL